MAPPLIVAEMHRSGTSLTAATPAGGPQEAALRRESPAAAKRFDALEREADAPGG